MQNALETLDTAKLCLDNKKYKDTINRCYYAAFYAIKAVLALEEKDFKRHKDAVAYFNQNYVAAGIFKLNIKSGAFVRLPFLFAKLSDPRRKYSSRFFCAQFIRRIWPYLSACASGILLRPGD